MQDASIALGEAEYVGAEGCKCHRAEFLDWDRSKHARAFDLLSPGKRKYAKKKAGLDPERDYSKSPKCLKCHVVGFGEPGGFLDMASTPSMAGVGCESCHGAGGNYRIIHGKRPLAFTKEEVKAAGQIYSSEDASVCTKCHGHKDSPFRRHIDAKYDFDYAAGLLKPDTFHNYYELKKVH